MIADIFGLLLLVAGVFWLAHKAATAWQARKNRRTLWRDLKETEPRR